MSSLLCLWRCLHPAILAMVAFCSLNPVEPFAFGEDKLSHSVQPEHWQRRGNCGVNVAYLMLKAYGRRVSYNELNNQLDPKPAIGNSALEIREETRRRGLNLDVVQLEPDDLTSIPLPAILYLEAEKGLGHYVILLDTDGVNARIIDGTKCFEEEVPLNSATRHWTGVALITSTRYDLRYVAALFLLIVSVSSGVLLLLRIKTPVTRVITFAAVLGLLMSLLFIVRAKVRTEPISTVADAISDKTYVQGESVRPFPIAPKGTPLNLLDRNSLAQMADMAKPYWPYRRMSLMLHCLRVFGPTMEFDGPAPFPVSKRTVGLSCPDILELILNADLYQSESNAKMPHFVQTRYYVRQEIGREPALAAHRDDILAMAAEIGLPLSTPIVANGRRFTLRDLLKNSLQSFDLDVELEFTAVAYCGYLWGAEQWRNRHGRQFSFDHLANRLIDNADNDVGTCMGTHIPYALAYMLQQDDLIPQLTRPTRRRIESFLRSLSRQLEKTQSSAGCFEPAIIGDSDVNDVEFAKNQQYYFRKLFTGHHLEWIALVDDDLRPSRSSIRRAVLWLSRAMLRHEPRDLLFLGRQYNVNSHIVRAVFLLHHEEAQNVSTTASQRN